MYATTDFTLGVYTDVQTIPAMLQALRERPLPAPGVLSAYLPTPPVQVAGQKYLVRFREEGKAIRQTLSEAGRAERQAFETAYARIEAYLTDMPLPRHPGLAVFAAAERGYLYAVPLPERPATLVGWGSELRLTPLEEVLDDYERVAVVLTDRCQARLFTIYLGEIEEQREITSADPGKSNIAGIAGNYARHYQEYVQRHLRRTAHATVELLRSQPFDRLILGGPDDVLALFKEVLPRPLRARFAGGLSLGLDATAAAVLEAARQVAEEIERRTEVALIDELMAAATGPRAALGVGPTLNALSDERVHHLFLASDFAAVGGECPTCQRLLVAADRCPVCAVPPELLAEIRDRVVDRALEQGARIEIVSGEAAARLRDHGGLGAWTRY